MDIILYELRRTVQFLLFLYFGMCFHIRIEKRTVLVYNKANTVRFVVQEREDMAKRGFNRTIILKEAKGLIEEKGLAQFSMRALANRLGMRPASLYNHIEGIEDVYTQLGKYIIQMLIDLQEEASRDKNADDAIRAIAHVYRNFAKEHPELYKIFLGLPMQKHLIPQNKAIKFFKPIVDVLERYPLDTIDIQHFQRIFRSIVNGFIVQEDYGFFAYYEIDREESFRRCVECFIREVHRCLENEKMV